MKNSVCFQCVAVLAESVENCINLSKLNNASKYPTNVVIAVSSFDINSKGDEKLVSLTVHLYKSNEAMFEDVVTMFLAGITSMMTSLRTSCRIHDI